MNLHALGCCGIKEIQGLHDWDTNRDSFFHIVKENNGVLPCAWICFNGVAKHDYVKNFASFLAEYKLGEVITLPNIVNPNSSNTLDVRMWAVDRHALLTWYQARTTHACDCRSCAYIRNDVAQRNAYNERVRNQAIATNSAEPTVIRMLVPPRDDHRGGVDLVGYDYTSNARSPF